jgi:hypothetical protein
MGITERVERMVVRVEAPSRSVSAEMRGRDDIVVRFAPGFYQRAGTHEMQAQLEQLGRLLWAAWMREYQRIVSDEHQQTYQETRPVSQLDYEFLEKRANLVAEGRSGDGRIHIAVLGMQQWKVRVAPDAMSTMGEDEFAAQVAVAARELIGDQRAKIRELKVTTYDPEFVADFKE